MSSRRELDGREATIHVSLSLVAVITFSEARPAEATGAKPKRNRTTSVQPKYEVETLASGLEHPWSLAFLPNGTALVTERVGRVRRFEEGKLSPPLRGLPKVYAAEQGGLLDVQLHPEFRRNRLVYFSFSAGEPSKNGTEVARARLDGNRLTDWRTIFVAEPKAKDGYQFGSRLLFDRDGLLYVTLGERYHRMQDAQRLSNHLGKIVRVHDDGAIPESNPFVGRKSAKGEVYSYGHRNVQGIAMRADGTLWAHEHGPRGGDELNHLVSGANYGWPTVTFGIDYSGAIISERSSAPGIEAPVVYWDPSIAPSGMTFYSGALFPEWKGDLFLGALAHTHLRRLRIEGGKVIEQEALLKSRRERIRDVREGPDGALYLLTDSPQGKLLRMGPQG